MKGYVTISFQTTFVLIRDSKRDKSECPNHIALSVMTTSHPFYGPLPLNVSSHLPFICVAGVNSYQYFFIPYISSR